MLLRKTIPLTFFGLSLGLLSHAGTIRGKIHDSKTGEPMTGATVKLAHTHFTTTVQLDGTFTFRHIPAGKYEVEASSVGYQPSKEMEVVLSSDNDSKDISLDLAPASVTLEEVQVTTASGGSNDNKARRLEQRSDIVQNVLSARNIELSPDVTMGNAMQRISGVSVQRGSSGEARYAIIRGMDQRYNNVLVNGIKIASPDDKYRFVPMDLFPSELIERLEVIKTLTPNMEADAIGGTMNLVMKDAPSSFLLTANVSGGYSTIFSDRPFAAFDRSGINKSSPAERFGNSYAAPISDFPLSTLKYHKVSSPINGTAGLTFGDRWLNKRLGFIISAGYQNFYRGSNSEFITPDAQPNAVLTTSPNYATYPQQLSMAHIYDRQYSTQTNRIGINNKIDYVFNSRNKISLYNFYVHQNEYQTRHTNDTTLGVNSNGGSSFTMAYENRSTWTIQDIYNATLQGSHQLGDRLKLDWTGSYSDAQKKVPDQSWNSFDGKVTYDNSGKLTSTDSTGGSMSRIWQHNKDQDWSGYANLTYTPRIAHRDVVLEAGGMYRHKTRNSYYNDYEPVSTQPSAQVHSLDSVPFDFIKAGTNTGNVTAVNYNTYTVHEKIAAGYIQAKFMLTQALQVLGGVRVENTQQDYATNMPYNSDQGYGSIHYTDVLPSAHLKYTLTPQQALRLSYFKSISRPGFGEIDPYVYPGEFYTEIGNPDLKHTRADNLDLRYEWFPGLADQVLLGAFYKKLENPIEYFVRTKGGPSALFIQPQNVNSATNYGLEAVLTKYFGNFGVSANYTYTHSKVTTPKLLYHYVGSSIHQDTVSQTRPLQGQADHIGNISALYKNQKIGLDLQLALSYTGDRIAQVQPYFEEDIWQKAYAQLDFSGEKRLSKRFYFFAKVNNLTNTPHQLYIKFPHSQVAEQPLPAQGSNSNITIVQKDYYKISFLGGFRFKF
jgi:outer membrane receptor protein involved in Fe transport